MQLFLTIDMTDISRSTHRFDRVLFSENLNNFERVIFEVEVDYYTI